MSTQYLDPINQNEIVDQLQNAPNMEKVYEIVNRVFPNWIENILDHYCPNYPHLEQNWHYLCRTNGFTPSQIIIVSHLSDDNDHMLMNNFLDLFYKAGFTVRLNKHCSPCSTCQQYVVPSEFMYNKLKEHNIRNLPSNWTSTCKRCNEQER